MSSVRGAGDISSCPNLTHHATGCMPHLQNYPGSTFPISGPPGHRMRLNTPGFPKLGNATDLRLRKPNDMRNERSARFSTLVRELQGCGKPEGNETWTLPVLGKQRAQRTMHADPPPPPPGSRHAPFAKKYPKAMLFGHYVPGLVGIARTCPGSTATPDNGGLFSTQ